MGNSWEHIGDRLIIFYLNRNDMLLLPSNKFQNVFPGVLHDCLPHYDASTSDPACLYVFHNVPSMACRYHFIPSVMPCSSVYLSLMLL